MVTILTYLSFLSDFCWNKNKNKPNQSLLYSLFQDSEGTSTSTETNNTSYESPNTQLFGARRMRAWHHHRGATPTIHKTVCYFSFWGRGGQEGWFKKYVFGLGQMSAPHECTDTNFMPQKCIFDDLISVFFSGSLSLNTLYIPFNIIKMTLFLVIWPILEARAEILTIVLLLFWNI